MDQGASIRLAKLDEVLRAVPYQYQNKDRLRQDVAALLRNCATLQPQTGSFSGQGRQVTLFYLYGVLPISYNGGSYNIPVTIYFDPPYPKQPPRCFVTPTTGMELKKGHPHVDAGGMIYIPYLSSWNERGSNLAELSTYLSSTFSQQPPVHATSKPPAAAQAKAQQSQQQVPVQAVPVVAATVSAHPARSQLSQKDEAVQKATEKLRGRWNAVVEPLVNDINDQMEKRAELEEGEKQVSAEIARLGAGVERNKREEEELRKAEVDLRAFVQANEGREPDPDDLREQADADTKLVLDRLSEELSLEELLLALDELLAARKISTEDFMRELRDVSRRQFMCKIERQKASAALGMAPASAVSTGTRELVAA